MKIVLSFYPSLLVLKESLTYFSEEVYLKRHKKKPPEERTCVQGDLKKGKERHIINS